MSTNKELKERTYDEKMEVMKKIAVIIIIFTMAAECLACGSKPVESEMERLRTKAEAPSMAFEDAVNILPDPMTDSKDRQDVIFLLSKMELFDSDGDRITPIELDTELWLPIIGLLIPYDSWLDSSPFELSRLEGDCVYYEYFYDGLGRLSQKIGYNTNDDVCFIYNYEYDIDGNIIGENGRKPENNSYAYTRTIERDIYGNILSDYFTYGDHFGQKHTYSYDSDGKLIDECFLREDDSVWYEQKYTYNAENTLQRSEIIWSSKSEIIDRYYLHYNYVHNSSGGIESREKYRLGWDYSVLTKYNRDGNVISEKMTTQSRNESITCEYNENGNIIKAHYSFLENQGGEDKSELKLEVNYIYDKHGNKVKEDIYAYQEEFQQKGETVFSVVYEYIPFTKRA